MSDQDSSNDVATNRDDRASNLPLVKLVTVGALMLAAVILILQVFVADKTPYLTGERLEAAEELWNQKEVANYDMDIELRGAQPGAVHVEIREGKISAETRNGRTPPEHTWYAWSVPGLFETLDQELVLAENPEKNMNAAPGTVLQLRCEFDPVYGFPTRYHRFATGNTPEVDWRVTKFQEM